MNHSVIFHIDVNSAFLSWSALEQLKQGSDTDLRLIPSIIGGDRSTRHGVVLAKSIPAKAFGISTGEPVASALRKCPSLVTAPPDHALYHRRSRQLMDYLCGICPDIEQVSIDECYMDYTPISANYASPEQAAAFIKDSVREKFGFTVNIGISDKKVLAKMASDFKKPDLVHTLYTGEIQEKLWPLPLSRLFLCGRSSVDTLRKLGILTIGDLALSDPSIPAAHLKSHGMLLWNYANGHDDSAVLPVPDQAKGIPLHSPPTQPPEKKLQRFCWSCRNPWEDAFGPPTSGQGRYARKSNTAPSAPCPIRRAWIRPLLPQM